MPVRRFALALRQVALRISHYSRDERAVLIGAAVALIKIDRSLKRRGYDATYAQTVKPHRLAVTVAHMSACEVARIVDTAARWTIGERESCLRRAIVLNWFLRSAGVACDLISGIGRRDHAWSGHAWVEVDGLPLGRAGEDIAGYGAFRDQLSRRGTPSMNSPIEPSRR